MSMVMMVVLCVLVGLILWLIGIYNRLIRLKNQVANALSQIDVQLKRRHDLIPNLVNATQGYLTHEKSTLEAVVSARQKAYDLQNSHQHHVDNGAHLSLLAKAEEALSMALGRLSVVVENYPDLKADGMTKALFDELANTENRIGFARQHYNDSVMFYNSEREMFPNNLISGAFDFKPLAHLEFKDRSQIDTAPVVTLQG